LNPNAVTKQEKLPIGSFSCFYSFPTNYNPLKN